MLKLFKNHKEVELTSVCSLKPFDEKYFISEFRKKKKILLLEEQIENVGFSSTIKNFLYTKKFFTKIFTRLEHQISF